MNSIKQILGAGLMYAILGAAGLALAIPPGYASPVFPAAGLALALILHFGNRVLPGIWLGSLSINLLVAWQNGTLDIYGAFIAAILATGAALQAWIAKGFVLRWTAEKWQFLESEKDIALFLAVAAPLSCLVSATVGVTTLYFAGVIQVIDFFFSWWNWWIGDMLGVLIFTPITLTFLLRHISPWKERLTSVAIPMLVTLGAVIVVFLGVSRWELRQQIEQIATSGKKIAQLLDHRLIAHQEALSSLRRLIEVTPFMTYKQFEYFTRITLQDNKDIFALSYNPYISHQQRKAFELSMSEKTIVPGFTITEWNSERLLVPAASRPSYVPVGYIAPLDGNLAAIGFDIYSDPLRRTAIQRAKNSGEPVVTDPIQLVQEQQKRVGILVLHPAYRTKTTSSGKTLSTLIGFAVAVIKVDQMVQIATLHQVPDGLVFHLSDTHADRERQVLFRSDNGAAKPVALYSWQTNLTLADRLWRLDVFPTTTYLRQNRSWFAWGTGIAGMLFATLLQVVMLAMTGRTFAIQRLVNDQTIELQQAKAQLESLNLSLQKRVDDTITELRQKDQVLISQGRQAAMGEMIGNIAHQWRQPLNALSMLITNIQFAQMHNQLNEEYLNESAATANRLIQKMSSTISDFRNFFSPDKEKVAFSALGQVRNAVELVNAAFSNSNIRININLEDDCLLYGFPNEYSQVLLNILSNSKDAITAQNPPLTGHIEITIKVADGMGSVSLRDNGGGIPEETLDKIFEPYFSTKNNGTGIGLYMSKMIIERNMDGRLSAHNTQDGAEFVILTPLAEKPS